MPAIFSALHVNMPHAVSVHAPAVRTRAATSGSELISGLTIEYFSEMKPLFQFIVLGLAWNEAGTPLARLYCEAKIPIFERADENRYLRTQAYPPPSDEHPSGLVVGTKTC